MIEAGSRYLKMMYSSASLFSTSSLLAMTLAGTVADEGDGRHERAMEERALEETSNLKIFAN